MRNFLAALGLLFVLAIGVAGGIAASHYYELDERIFGEEEKQLGAPMQERLMFNVPVGGTLTVSNELKQGQLVVGDIALSSFTSIIWSLTVKDPDGNVVLDTGRITLLERDFEFKAEKAGVYTLHFWSHGSLAVDLKISGEGWTVER